MLPFDNESSIITNNNEVLKNAEIYLKDKIYGPESLAIHEETQHIFSGLRNGLIIEMDINEQGEINIVREFRLHDIHQGSCDGTFKSFPKCGRPLGVRFRKLYRNKLFIADAYHGLYELDIITGKSKLILQAGTLITNNISDLPLRHLNDFDETFNGKIILSEPSMKFSDRDCILAMLEHSGDGRILSYDDRRNELKVIASGLQYPNGIQIEGDNCVLVSEMGNFRILRFCYDEPNWKATIFIDNLPGYPDNVRLSAQGFVWIPLPEVRLEDDKWLTMNSFLRNMIAAFIPPSILMDLLKWIAPKYGLVLAVNRDNASIIRSLHDPDGRTISAITEVAEMNDGTLLFGSDTNNFIAKLDKNY